MAIIAGVQKKKAVVSWGFVGGMTLVAGATNTKVLNITGGTQTGDWSRYFTIAQSASLGTTFTATKRFAVTGFVSGNSPGSDTFNISVNSNQLTTIYTTISDAHRLTAPHSVGAAGGGTGARIIEVGDVIRVHLDSAAPSADGWFKLTFQIDENII